MDLLSMFRVSLERDGDRFAIAINDGRRTTDLRLVDIARGMSAYATAYERSGVSPGDRVVIALPTSREFLFAFWGCYLCGAIPIPTYPPLLGRVERLVGILARSKAAALVTLPALRDVLQSGKVPLPALVEAREEDGAHFKERVAAARVSGRDTALIQFTSGSTVAPRGCVLSQAAVAANAVAVVERLEISKDDVGVVWLPLYHDMGLMAGAILPMVAAAKVVLIGPERFTVDPLIWLDALHRHRATLSAAPNFAFSFVAKRLAGANESYDLSCVRSIFNGAEPIDPAAVRAFLEALQPHGLRPSVVQAAWGLAENTVFATSAPGGLRTDIVDRDAIARQGRAVRVTTEAGGLEITCLGYPYPGADVRVVDKSRAPVDDRVVGDVELRSPSLMDGYLDDPEETVRVLPDGWLRTGDVGYLTEGKLYLVGRAKDLIILGGRNLAPQDVERSVDGLPGVRDGNVAAFGTPSPHGTEQVVLVVEVNPTLPAQDRHALAEVLRRSCHDRLGVTPEVVLVDPGRLPKTSSRKLQRSLARQMFLNGSLAPAKAKA